MESNYVQKREYVISEVLNNTKRVYPGDFEMLAGVIGLTAKLQIAENNDKFINGMLGFMSWASQTEQDVSSSLTTLIHDLGEFSRYGSEDWFSPRTARYEKYLTGACG